MEITAAMVKALRDKTGLSMMEVKKALTETMGDEAKAIEWLRKRGHAKAGEMTTREASQGRIACYVDSKAGRAGIVELRCETAPVANTDDFIRLTNMLARGAATMDSPTPPTLLQQKQPDDPSKTMADAVSDVFNRLRENIQIHRCANLHGSVGHYLHHNGQVGVIIEASAPCSDDVKTDICMHVAAMRPPYLRREDVDVATVDRERRLATEAAQGKPANIIDKIVQGKLNTWFAEVCLLEQPFVKDDKKSVTQFLQSVQPGLTINRVIRFEVGAS